MEHCVVPCTQLYNTFLLYMWLLIAHSVVHSLVGCTDGETAPVDFPVCLASSSALNSEPHPGEGSPQRGIQGHWEVVR